MVKTRKVISQSALKKSRTKHDVFIVDDHPVVCKGLTYLIDSEADLSVCGTAGDIPSALRAIRRYIPDVAIIDITLGEVNGIRLVEELARQYPTLPTLVLSVHDESHYAERSLRAGANGYVMKTESHDIILSALRRVLSGNVYVSENMKNSLLNQLITRPEDGSSRSVACLSTRELEVFELIGMGLKNKAIAERLELSVKTIETYIDHIKKKMHFTSSRDLFMNAVQWSMGEEQRP